MSVYGQPETNSIQRISKAPSRPLQIRESLEFLGKAVGELEQNVAELDARCQPLAVQYPQTEHGASVPKEVLARCDLSDQLERLAGRIGTMAVITRRLLDTLEL